MKKINLIYWNEANFGDALSPKLINELTGLEIQYKDADFSKNLRLVIKSFFKLDFRRLAIPLLPWEEVMGCIGSILKWLPKGSKVWGSGFMNENERFLGGEIYAVRGEFTSNSLVKQGYPKCNIYGDPALLLPLWLKPEVEKKHPLGIIPHHTEVDYFKEKYGDKYFIIDLRTRDVERIVEEILLCEYVLSTSLHGVIVGHAYNIPSLWIKKGNIGTDGFKFHDYFSSVNIPLYSGFQNIEDILKSETEWRSLFLDNRDKMQVNIDLFSLQKNLLKAFPYPLKSEYKKMI